MKVISYLDNQGFVEPMGVGLGNFDGLHIGHMELINTLLSECKSRRLNSLVYTFLRHPENIIKNKVSTPLITNIHQKKNLLGNTLLEYICFDKFDEAFSKMTPESFVKDILVKKLNAKLVIVGFNYRFGYKGLGDTKLLEKMGKDLGYNVIIIPPIKIDNEIVSSTIIREYISKGNMRKVYNLLGREFSILGEVVYGRQIGSRIGFPTANIIPEDYFIIPSGGVYITRSLIDGAFYFSVTNVGSNPTVTNEKKISIETHILDYNGHLYGKNIEVYFIKKIRDEKTFRDMEELALEIQNDVKCAREYIKNGI